jgi:hypothetical protein
VPQATPSDGLAARLNELQRRVHILQIDDGNLPALEEIGWAQLLCSIFGEKVRSLDTPELRTQRLPRSGVFLWGISSNRLRNLILRISKRTPEPWPGPGTHLVFGMRNAARNNVN